MWKHLNKITEKYLCDILKKKIPSKIIGRHWCVCMCARECIYYKWKGHYKIMHVNNIQTNIVTEKDRANSKYCVCLMYDVWQRGKHQVPNFFNIVFISFHPHLGCFFAFSKRRHRSYSVYPPFRLISLSLSFVSAQAQLLNQHTKLFGIIMKVESSNSRENHTNTYMNDRDTCICVHTWPHFVNDVLMLCSVFTHTIQPFEGKPFVLIVAMNERRG